MKVEIIATSDLHSKTFSEELFVEINQISFDDVEFSFTVTDNFINEVYDACVTFAIFLGPVIVAKSVEKIIDYIVDTVRKKMKEKENYDTKVVINIHIDKIENNNQYNLLTDIDKLKTDIKNAIK